MKKLKDALLDKGMEKIMSRKLLVWVIATIGVPMAFINGEQWMQISMVYIGSQAAKDFIIDYVKAKQSQPISNPDT